MPEPGTWIQLNFKTPAGSLLNIYAEDGVQLDDGMDALEARLGRIADIERMITATGVVNTAFSQPSVPQQRQPEQTWTQQPEAAQPSSAPAGPAPMCAHGAKKWVEPGISKNTGRPYSGFWTCPMPKGQQCR